MIDVSIVLPCFGGASIAQRSVETLREALSRRGVTWQIVVVDDGGGDFAPDAWNDDPQITLIRLPTNVGKGAAVRRGMLAAQGAVRIFTDVDLPFGTQSVEAMLDVLRDTQAQVVIGDRTHRSSAYRLHLTWGRRVASWVFTAFVGTIVTGGFYDTQCGLKGMRGDVADALFRVLRIDRFAFDVELVYVALKHQLAIARIPVRLVHNETSSVRLVRDSAQGFVDVFRIRYHFARGWYGDARLQAIGGRAPVVLREPLRAISERTGS